MRYKDTTKADEMRRHIEACRAGTQTVNAYCQQHSIKKPVYYYWHKRLTKQPPERAGFVALNIAGKGNQSADVIVNCIPSANPVIVEQYVKDNFAAAVGVADFWR